MRFDQITNSPKNRLAKVIETLKNEHDIAINFKSAKDISETKAIAEELVALGKELSDSALAEEIKPGLAASYLVLEAIKLYTEIHTINEAELQKAEYMLASKDIVDQIQKMVQNVSDIQSQKIPAIVDRMKMDAGMETAENYKTTAASLIASLIDSLNAAKDGMDNLTLGLSGDVDLATAPEAAGAPEAEPELPAPGAEETPVEEPEEPAQLKNPIGRERKEESRKPTGKKIVEGSKKKSKNSEIAESTNKKWHVTVKEGNKVIANNKVTAKNFAEATTKIKNSIISQQGLKEWNNEYEISVKPIKESVDEKINEVNHLVLNSVRQHDHIKDQLIAKVIKLVKGHDMMDTEDAIEEVLLTYKDKISKVTNPDILHSELVNHFAKFPIKESATGSFEDGDIVRILKTENPTAYDGKVGKVIAKSDNTIDVAIRSTGDIVSFDASHLKKITEAWDTKMHTKTSEKGKWEGWTKQELEHKLSTLKNKKEHSAEDTTTIKQIEFALRAKGKGKKHTNKWGKVKESIAVFESDDDDSEDETDCDACSGDGFDPDSVKPKMCKQCKGTGVITGLRDLFDESVDEPETFADDSTIELDEASRKHFRAAAELIKSMKDPEERKKMAHGHAEMYKKQNPRFDHGRFMQACGVEEAVHKVEEAPRMKSLAGSDIKNVAKKAVDAAKRDKRNKYFSFNGHKFSVTPDSTVEQILKQWNEKRGVKEIADLKKKSNVENPAFGVIAHKLDTLQDEDAYNDMLDALGIPSHEYSLKDRAPKERIMAALRVAPDHTVRHIESELGTGQYDADGVKESPNSAQTVTAQQKPMPSMFNKGNARMPASDNDSATSGKPAQKQVGVPVQTLNKGDTVMHNGQEATVDSDNGSSVGIKIGNGPVQMVDKTQIEQQKTNEDLNASFKLGAGNQPQKKTVPMKPGVRIMAQGHKPVMVDDADNKNPNATMVKVRDPQTNLTRNVPKDQLSDEEDGIDKSSGTTTPTSITSATASSTSSTTESASPMTNLLDKLADKVMGMVKKGTATKEQAIDLVINKYKKEIEQKSDIDVDVLHQDLISYFENLVDEGKVNENVKNARKLQMTVELHNGKKGCKTFECEDHAKEWIAKHGHNVKHFHKIQFLDEDDVNFPGVPAELTQDPNTGLVSGSIKEDVIPFPGSSKMRNPNLEKHRQKNNPTKAEVLPLKPEKKLGEDEYSDPAYDSKWTITLSDGTDTKKIIVKAADEEEAEIKAETKAQMMWGLKWTVKSAVNEGFKEEICKTCKKPQSECVCESEIKEDVVELGVYSKKDLNDMIEAVQEYYDNNSEDEDDIKGALEWILLHNEDVVRSQKNSKAFVDALYKHFDITENAAAGATSAGAIAQAPQPLFKKPKERKLEEANEKKWMSEDDMINILPKKLARNWKRFIEGFLVPFSPEVYTEELNNFFDEEGIKLVASNAKIDDGLVSWLISKAAKKEETINEFSGLVTIEQLLALKKNDPAKFAERVSKLGLKPNADRADVEKAFAKKAENEKWHNIMKRDK